MFRLLCFGSFDFQISPVFISHCKVKITQNYNRDLNIGQVWYSNGQNCLVCSSQRSTTLSQFQNLYYMPFLYIIICTCTNEPQKCFHSFPISVHAIYPDTKANLVIERNGNCKDQSSPSCLHVTHNIILYLIRLYYYLWVKQVISHYNIGGEGSPILLHLV